MEFGLNFLNYSAITDKHG